MCIPAIETSRSAGVTRPTTHRNRAIAAVKTTMDAAFETSTAVRLFGLPSSSPMVRFLSSPANDAAPIASAIPVTVSAP